VFTASVSLTVVACALGLLLFQTLMLLRIGITLDASLLWLGRRNRNTDQAAVLPASLQGKRVDRMEADNQYTLVHCGDTTHELRMQLTAAATAPDLPDGLQVHRSHWVALHMLSSVKYVSGNPRLTLTDGTEIPVSRKRLPSVRAALAQRPPLK
jgi:hypothetical protein